MSIAWGEDACVFASIGALFVLYVLMAMRMSFYRLAGSPGEGKPGSPLERFHEVQMLAAEWTPIGAGLALGLVVKGTVPSFYRSCLVGAFVASRFLFTVSKLNRLPMIVNVVSMVTCYTAALAMALAIALL